MCIYFCHYYRDLFPNTIYVFEAWSLGYVLSFEILKCRLGVYMIMTHVTVIDLPDMLCMLACKREFQSGFATKNRVCFWVIRTLPSANNGSNFLFSSFVCHQLE